MNKKVFKSFVMVFCIFLSTNAFAESATVGYLTYSFSGNNATIIGYDAGSIPEKLIIPETVEYKGLTFNVTEISNNAFNECSKIKSLKINQRLSAVGSSAFYGCSNLETIDVNAYEIGKSAFKDCKSLKTVTIKAMGINSYAFSGCASVESITLDGVVDIYDDAFSNCSNLKRIDFGKTLRRIGSFAFGNCNSLTYLVFPSTLRLICPTQKVNYLSVNSYHICPYNCWGESCHNYYYYNAAKNELPSDYPLPSTSSPFTGCDLIQSVIYLGGYVSTGLDNVNGYDLGYNPDYAFTWSSNNFTYTGKVPTPTYTCNLPAGFKPSNMSALPTLEKNVGKYTTYLPVTFANNDMSFDVEIPYTYTINPVKLKAKAKDATRQYGDADPQFSSTYTGFVNNEDARVIESHGTYSTTATAKSDVGTYAIRQSGASAMNYVFEYEDGTLTVNKAPLTMTANDKSMTYGSKVPTLDARYEGLKNGEKQPAWNREPTFATTASATSKVGTYPITISNADAKNYQLTVCNGTMKVEKAELTVRAENKSRTYGDANPEFTMVYTGLKNNETVPAWEKAPSIVTTADRQSPVGSYHISVKDGVAVNYNINAVDGTLTVNKATLQVTPKNATRKYGEENPKFELSYVGLKNNENTPEWTESPVVTTSATKTSPVGEYAIQMASGIARNYTLEKKNGTLTITKAPLAIGVKSYTRKYGETNPNFELNYTGLLNGETAPAWTEMPTIKTEATETSDVGEYAITAIGGMMKNYEASGIAPGTLTITPVSLQIKANNASRLYFEDNPSFSYSCTGFVGNDNESVLTVKPQIRTNATQNSNVGVYPIEIDGAETKNYLLSYEKGQLTVNKRQLTVSTKDYTRAYGEENPQFELTYKGFVNNEDESVLLSKPKATTEATTNTDTGVYDIIIDNGVAENYDFLYVGGKLTIEKAYQTLTWEQDFNDIKQYDQVELAAVASSGLEVTYTVEGEQICSVFQIGKKQYLDCKGTGEAVIVAIQEGNNNYWQTTKIYKPIVIISTSIDNLISIDSDGSTKIFDAKGYRLGKLQRGVNIIKKEDGTTQKVLVK